MAKGSSLGYVFVLLDPDTHDYKYVSNGLDPYKTIDRMFRYPVSDTILPWLKEIAYNHTEGVYIPKYNPLREYLGQPVDEEEERKIKELQAKDSGIIEWKILDEELNDDGSMLVLGASRKYYWVKRLQAEGHNLLNIIPGTNKGKNK